MSDDDLPLSTVAKEKQTSSITRFFKTIPKSAVPCNSDSITNDDAGEKTAKIKEPSNATHNSSFEDELIHNEIEDTNTELSIIKSKSNEVPPKTIKGKSPNSKKDKGDVQIRSGIRKRKESNVRTVTPPLESSTSANDDVVFVSYEKFLESSHVDSKSVTNDLTAAVHAETKNSSQIINAHTSKTKKEHKLASIFIEAKSQELCTLNSKRNINEFFKSNQACKTEKSLHCNSLPKKVLTKKKLRRKQAVVRRYADDDCTSVRRLRSTHHLESTTECRVGAQDDECANTNTSVTNTAKKLKCNRRSSGRNVLPNPEVRRSSRLQDACKRMLTDSCVEQKVRTKINKHLEVQKNGPGSLSSYKVAFITSRKSNNGIKIRLTRLCNQNDKPAITVQKASRLLKRAKLGSAIGTKPVSFIPSSRKPQNDGVCRTGNGKTSKMVKGQMAPIFRQIGPKKKTPVLDEAVIERRQRFLMSGIPEKLKKQLEKTEAYMPMELLFPTIGHIQQKDVNTEESSLWNLQWPTCFVHLNLSEIDLPPIIHGNLHYGMLTKCQLELCSTTTRKSSEKSVVHPTLSSTEVFRVLSDIKEHYNSSANVDDIYQSYVQKRRVASLLPVIDVEGGETLSPQSSKPIEIALCGSDDDANHVVTKRKRMVSAILFSDSEESRNDCKKRHKATGPLGPSNKKSTKTCKSPQHATASKSSTTCSEVQELESTTRNKSPTPLFHKNSTALWTTIYRPVTSQDIIGNKSSIQQLKSWLTRWKTASLSAVQKERKLSKTSRKRKNEFDDDHSDFDTDSDSESNYADMCNTVLLIGPSGSGKSATVYALATELGYKVLEVNSTSKRSGKQVLAQLQEATQSHQVGERRCGGPSSPSTKKSNPSQKHAMMTEFFLSSKKQARENPSKGANNADEDTLTSASSQDPSVVSLILFQDVDVVFSEDEGFWSAVNSFMSTAKRPIILTSSDLKFSDRGRVKENYQEIVFDTPDIQLQCLHLQLLCLAERAVLNANDGLSIIRKYNGNYRESLLNLQFWNDSWTDKYNEIGTHLVDTRGVDSSCLLPPDLRFTNERNKTKVIDESLNSLHNLFKENGNICRTALSCISDFLDNKCNPRLGRDGKLSSAAEILPGFHDSEDKGRDVEHVLDDDYARDYWDSLNLMNDSSLKSSLNEKLSGYDIDVENVGNQLADKFCNDELSNEDHSHQKIISSLSPMSQMNLRACHLDYMPFLRAIGRSEFERRLSGAKRGRRFSHYLCSNVLYLDEAVVDSLLNEFQA